MLVWSNSKPSAWHSEPFVVRDALPFHFISPPLWLVCSQSPPCFLIHLHVFASMESHVGITLPLHLYVHESPIHQHPACGPSPPSASLCLPLPSDLSSFFSHHHMVSYHFTREYLMLVSADSGWMDGWMDGWVDGQTYRG